MENVYVVTDLTRSITGGDGFNTLDFGPYQAYSVEIWNKSGISGGTFQVTNQATGSQWSLDYQNIQALDGSPGNDYLVANSQIAAIDGGSGDDTIQGQTPDAPISYNFRGGDGADSISGGDLADGANGNLGNDTIYGWEGDDLLRGGQGDNRLNGNAGNDTLYGDLGNDTVCGGQGNDSLSGGDGNDSLSGDRGDDTMAGGGGADTFHALSDGNDRVTDFNASEGDRVQVDPSSTYTLSQSGPDTVITFANGATTTLAGVTLSSLPSGWIFGA